MRIGSIFLAALIVATVFVAGNGFVNTSNADSDREPDMRAMPTSDNAASDPGQVVIASGSNRFAVWQDFTPGNYDIFFRRSTDNGATWKSSVNLSNNPGVSRYPQLALSGSNVYIAWEQSDAGGSQSDIFFRRSLDGGATWGSKVNLSQNGHSIEPVLAAVGSSVYAAWISPICCDNDIFFERSTDNGSTWSPSKNLGSNAAGRSVAPQIAT